MVDRSVGALSLFPEPYHTTKLFTRIQALYAEFALRCSSGLLFASSEKVNRQKKPFSPR